MIEYSYLFINESLKLCKICTFSAQVESLPRHLYRVNIIHRNKMWSY